MFRSNRSKEKFKFRTFNFFFPSCHPSVAYRGGGSEDDDRHRPSRLVDVPTIVKINDARYNVHVATGRRRRRRRNTRERGRRERRTPRAFFFPRLSLPVCSALYSILRIRRNGKKNRDINRPFHPNDQSSINNLRTSTFDPGLIPNTTRTTWIDLSIARAISLCHRSFRILNTRATVQ